jgi:hypothetical protein
MVRYPVVKVRYDITVDMPEHADGWGMQKPRRDEKYIYSFDSDT